MFSILKLIADTGVGFTVEGTDFDDTVTYTTANSGVFDVHYTLHCAGGGPQGDDWIGRIAVNGVAPTDLSGYSRNLNILNGYVTGHAQVTATAGQVISLQVAHIDPLGNAVARSSPLFGATAIYVQQLS